MHCYLCRETKKKTGQKKQEQIIKRVRPTGRMHRMENKNKKEESREIKQAKEAEIGVEIEAKTESEIEATIKAAKEITKEVNDTTIEALLADLIRRYPKLEGEKESIRTTYAMMVQAFETGGKLLVAGNGGSAADAEHIVGELMKGFKKKRLLDPAIQNKLTAVDPVLGSKLAVKLQGALPAVSLAGHPALATAYLNDVDPILGMAQQVNGIGNKGDVLLAISTSGNSANLLYAAVTAKAKGIKVIALTGNGGGRLKAYADAMINIKETETYKIQELHLPVYHTLCLMLEETFFRE